MSSVFFDKVKELVGGGCVFMEVSPCQRVFKINRDKNNSDTVEKFSLKMLCDLNIFDVLGSSFPYKP